MKKKLICIICPRGCALHVEGEGENLAVTGNSCPRGHQYALDETLHPTRTVTSTVRVANREDTMVSVKTADPITKERIFEAMAQIRKTEVNAPIKAGTVLLPDLFGSKLVTTKTIL